MHPSCSYSPLYNLASGPVEPGNFPSAQCIIKIAAEMADPSPEFVTVTTPGGSMKMTLAPFTETPSKTKSGAKKSGQKKRKAQELSSNSSSSPKAAVTSPTTTPHATSWLKNLERRGGFWGDAFWYDLQLEKRMPQAKKMLEELVLAVPPCGDKKVSSETWNITPAVFFLTVIYHQEHSWNLLSDQDRIQRHDLSTT
ncbi:unnamed protein product [Phytophthora lilii]|uniref:Unnamed protein product n=1 Tax=Phytophthora lilii TaxID=2077276 RepID=A0A9W6U9W4_9STRA|nr:unnamed protein product [Phytophthora lilii]